jgi:hypothetical protein
MLQALVMSPAFIFLLKHFPLSTCWSSGSSNDFKISSRTTLDKLVEVLMQRIENVGGWWVRRGSFSGRIDQYEMVTWSSIRAQKCRYRNYLSERKRLEKKSLTESPLLKHLVNHL